VVTVQGDVPEEGQGRTLAEMLYRVPGVQVSELSGGRLSVRVRGSNSFLGGMEPLYVYNGMVIQALEGINPNTIESITVLKNADATAIYGSRGANGVILIKTKIRDN
jgi:TonB-dependent SusC/RagA subfamily outer membrane receptor